MLCQDQECVERMAQLHTRLHDVMFIIIIIMKLLGGVTLSPLGTPSTVGPTVPDECGTFGGIRIGRGNCNAQRKPA
jgi:hypothetical protein